MFKFTSENNKKMAEFLRKSISFQEIEKCKIIPTKSNYFIGTKRIEEVTITRTKI